MTSTSADDLAAGHVAFKAWWRELTLRCDPIHKPNLTSDAFTAGYQAALDASQARLAQAEQEGRNKILELHKSWNAERASALAPTVKKVLRDHWLTWMGCDPELPRHTDRTRTACYCGVWRSDPLPTVGDAINAWIEHVFEHVAREALSQAAVTATASDEPT